MTAGLVWVRRKQRSLARVVLALFVAASLQAAIAPCTMAQGAEPQLVAPSEAGHAAHPAHGNHAQGEAGAAHHDGDAGHPCLYCPPGADHGPSGECDGAHCTYPHEPQADARAAGLLFVALPVVFVLPAPAASVVAECSEASVAEAIPRNRLSVSYCRFIE